MATTRQLIKKAKEQERAKVVTELTEVLIDCWGGNKLLLGKDWQRLQSGNGKIKKEGEHNG